MIEMNSCNTGGTGGSIWSSSPSRWAEENLLYLEWAGHFFCDESFWVERKESKCFLLIYTIAGSGVVESPLGKGICREGDAALLDGSDFYRCYTEKDHWEFYWILFDGYNSVCLVKSVLERTGNVVHMAEDTLSGELFRRIVEGRKPHTLPDEVETSAAIQMILAELPVKGTADMKAEHRNVLLSTALDYMDQNYCGKVAIEDVADSMGLSKSYFCAFFKKETGYSPYDFIMNLRLNRAKELLKLSSKSVNEISGEVGFNSAAGFIKTFRDRFGITPKVFRNEKCTLTDR